MISYALCSRQEIKGLYNGHILCLNVKVNYVHIRRHNKVIFHSLIIHVILIQPQIPFYGMFKPYKIAKEGEVEGEECEDEFLKQAPGNVIACATG